MPTTTPSLDTRARRTAGAAFTGPSAREHVSLAAVCLLALAACAGAPATPDGAAAAETAGAGGADPATQQQVALVTGSTSGLGEEVARRLAAGGAHVIIHGRSRERGEALVREIEAGGGSASFVAADLASLDEVRALARAVLEDYDRLDILVNNAGIGSAAGGRQVSADGYELVFQVNYLSHFLLTHELLPLLIASAPARIVNVASAAQNPIDFDDVMLEREGAIARAYGQSKLAQVMHAFDLAEELEGAGVIVNTLHPATFMDTEMVRRTGRQPLSTVDEGADAVMQLLTEDVGSGGYFNGLNRARANAQAYDVEVRTRLRQLSRELVGLDPGAD